MLQNNAVLANIRISRWAASKMDKQATAEVQYANHAAEGTARVIKALVSKEALKEVNAVASKARTTFYDYTLAWQDDGQRVLPVAKLDALREKIDALRIEYDNAVGAFVRNYAQEVERARFQLGGLFKSDDYPHPDDVWRKFDIRLTILPFPDRVDDFRVNASEDVRQSIAAQVRHAMADAQASVVKALYANLREQVQAVRDRMADVDARFKVNLIDNLRECVNTLDDFNVTNDKSLRELGDQLRRDMTLLDDPVALREDPVARKAVVTALDDALSRMAGFE